MHQVPMQKRFTASLHLRAGKLKYNWCFDEVSFSIFRDPFSPLFKVQSIPMEQVIGFLCCYRVHVLLQAILFFLNLNYAILSS